MLKGIFPSEFSPEIITSPHLKSLREFHHKAKKHKLKLWEWTVSLKFRGIQILWRNQTSANKRLFSIPLEHGWKHLAFEVLVLILWGESVLEVSSDNSTWSYWRLIFIILLTDWELNSLEWSSSWTCFTICKSIIFFLPSLERHHLHYFLTIIFYCIVFMINLYNPWENSPQRLLSCHHSSLVNPISLQHSSFLK